MQTLAVASSTMRLAGFQPLLILLSKPTYNRREIEDDRVELPPPLRLPHRLPDAIPHWLHNTCRDGAGRQCTELSARQGNHAWGQQEHAVVVSFSAGTSPLACMPTGVAIPLGPLVTPACKGRPGAPGCWQSRWGSPLAAAACRAPPVSARTWRGCGRCRGRCPAVAPAWLQQRRAAAHYKSRPASCMKGPHCRPWRSANLALRGHCG